MSVFSCCSAMCVDTSCINWTYYVGYLDGKQSKLTIMPDYIKSSQQGICPLSVASHFTVRDHEQASAERGTLYSHSAQLSS